MFNENIWHKTDVIKFVTVFCFTCEEREWNDKLAIDVILIVLEHQNVSPIISCINLNHMVRPLWDNIREEVFSNMEWDTFDDYQSFNDSNAGEF